MARRLGTDFNEARKWLAARKAGEKSKKASSPLEIIAKEVQQDFTLAMVHYRTENARDPSSQIDKKLLGEDQDVTLFVVYDHRVNNQLEKIAKNLLGDLNSELPNVFVSIV